MIENNLEKYLDNLISMDEDSFIEIGDDMFDYLSLMSVEIYL
jgi:hypothetical protein